MSSNPGSSGQRRPQNRGVQDHPGRERSIRLRRLFLASAAFIAILESGCRPPAPPSSYYYRAINNDCNCLEYRVADRPAKVEYLFRARYTMEEGVVTHIEIELTNNNRDSLLLGRGSIRVKSNNIAYQYNDKFLPLPEMIIPPYQRDVVKLVGREVNGKEDWNKIAGEQLRITIKGIRAGERELAAQTAIFIPENPKVRGY